MRRDIKRRVKLKIPFKGSGPRSPAIILLPAQRSSWTPVLNKRNGHIRHLLLWSRGSRAGGSRFEGPRLAQVRPIRQQEPAQNVREGASRSRTAPSHSGNNTPARAGGVAERRGTVWNSAAGSGALTGGGFLFTPMSVATSLLTSALTEPT